MGTQKLSFGWKVNRRADGFEQQHGRFTMEVFWSEAERVWKWAVWVDQNIDGKFQQSILAQGRSGRLADAKKTVMREAAEFERDSIDEDKKFR